ncbi:hypothetical protein F441_22715 [Phytophthora nicotianae CJ01A1]|uniref:Uncharacterized protein n=1 Tax=Phytophthora nicotianae CJ01A1 TaxID=1317063 RepID=W2VNV4_PHYNI|nr:hypothetical protein F441_22715 [Phytophthora nicotianae CJ01A1]
MSMDWRRSLPACLRLGVSICHTMDVMHWEVSCVTRLPVAQAQSRSLAMEAQYAPI